MFVHSFYSPRIGLIDRIVHIFLLFNRLQTVGIYQGVGSEDVVDNAGMISMRYSINDYRLRSDGLVGNVHSNSSVVGGGISAVTGTGGMASSSSSIIADTPHSPTPPLQRRLAKSFSVAPSSTQNKGAISFCIIYTLETLVEMLSPQP